MYTAKIGFFMANTGENPSVLLCQSKVMAERTFAFKLILQPWDTLIPHGSFRRIRNPNPRVRASVAKQTNIPGCQVPIPFSCVLKYR